MRHAWGIHLPNGNMDLGRWIDLIGNGCYTLLSDQGNVLRDLRSRAPEALILVRMYVRNWTLNSPEGWAANCLEFYLANKQYTKHLTWANEQNLSAESDGSIGVPDNPCDVYMYRAIADWNERFIAYFRNHGGEDAILHYPACATGISDDQNDNGFIGLAECARGINQCEILDRHFYPRLGEPVSDQWLGAARVRLTEALFPDKPLFISEFANFRITDSNTPQHLVDCGYYWQGDSHVLGWTGFIADDPTGAHQDNCWPKNQTLLDRYKNTTRTEKPEQGYVPILPPAPPPTGWDIGAGFKKCVPILGEPKENEFYHFKDLPELKVSVAVFEDGYATWNPQTNETVAYKKSDASIWRDGGNNPVAGGNMVQV